VSVPAFNWKITDLPRSLPDTPLFIHLSGEFYNDDEDGDDDHNNARNINNNCFSMRNIIEAYLSSVNRVH
jgi:hypothetical protein